MARVQVLNEVCTDGDWKLCFQWCRYIFDDGDLQHGYRFIWKRKDGSLQAARGQARIPSVKLMNELVARATDQGWADNEGEFD